MEMSRTRKAWQEANKEKITKQKREWIEANRDKARAYCKKYKAANKEKLREKAKKYEAVNKDKITKQKKKYKLENFELVMFRGARQRAKSRGLDFSISVDDIVVPDVCPALGIPLVRDNIKPCNNSPSLDRKDNSKGYIKGNVHVISRRANTIKNDSTIEELKMIIAYMES